jgi:hypothetical protein
MIRKTAPAMPTVQDESLPLHSHRWGVDCAHPIRQSNNEVGTCTGRSRGPVHHQLLAEFFPVRGFSRLTGEREDAGVEDCIPWNNISCSHDTKTGSEASGQKLMGGEDSVTPG